VAKYLVRRQQPPSLTWRTFLGNHITQIVAADFFVVPNATYRLLFVLVILAHDRRRGVHVAVAAHPTAQLREAFPWDEAPRFLLRDRDHAFDGLPAAARAMGIHDVRTAPQPPASTASCKEAPSDGRGRASQSCERCPYSPAGPTVASDASRPAWLTRL
jgi:hypothetical protein